MCIPIKYLNGRNNYWKKAPIFLTKKKIRSYYKKKDENLVYRYNLYPFKTWVCLSGSNYGLVFTQNIKLELINKY
ncbi:MAG: hypothetical protein A2Y41_03580 [Spirochaetes bacterium GWB1_36_13]|nr:MAG: hypothetical protein A2Y41_03580 [Spirochaetes bacterium GWB1_36_13]